MERLLNFEAPFDVAAFEEVAMMSLTGDPKANQVLVQFQSHPSAWTRVDTIIQKAQRAETKFLAMNILGDLVRFRWNILPPPQKEGIRSFLVNLIVQISRDPVQMAAQRPLLGKMNAVLIEVLKHEWPHNWPTFIPELVHSSRAGESICANNMEILRLLSEEIFDFSGETMTTEKVKNLKKSLNREFALIYQLCEFMLENSTDRVLLLATLKTLQRFLSWIPVGYIFETKLIETLCVKYFPVALFQNETLLCLAEIAGLVVKEHPEYNPKFVNLFASVTKQVAQFLTPETDVAKIYATGNPQVQLFVRHLTLFISAFLKSHLALIENGGQQGQQVLYISLTFLLRMSAVEDVTIFKICLECWSALVSDLFNAQRATVQTPAFMIGQVQKPAGNQRLSMYASVLTALRQVVIGRMAKPEEVIIVEDESGEIVREQARDTDAIILYRQMRDCLIYLTHLDPVDTQEIMTSKLARQVEGKEWSHHNLNTLCWAIGSISGALSEAAEKSFLVRVIKDLLHLCEIKRGKDHKAVIASNIMYVVGQYPRFLRMHWKFLKTVVNKLFEFMHEKHPGVQDMSCDTFLKIALKCRRKFVTVQVAEVRPYIDQMLEDLPMHVKDLEPQQLHTFYEAMGCIIQSQTDPEKRQILVMKLMAMPNTAWASMIASANQNLEALWDPKTVKNVVWILKTNNRVASSLGGGYIVQLARIYVEMLHVYKLYSGFISSAISAKGEQATHEARIRDMRAVKKEVLKLLQTFVQNCQPADHDTFLKQVLPALLDPVLDDFKVGVPSAREAEVLLLFSEIINTFGQALVPLVPRVFDSVMAATLQMITGNFVDFPEHRLFFFRLLRAINAKCFRALLGLAPPQFQLVMDSVVWAFKHMERNIADTGLNILLEMLKTVQTTEVANQFYKTYLMSLIQDILGVMTDSFHKPGLQTQSEILAMLIQVVETGAITVPLWTPDKNFPNNQTFVRQFITNMIGTAFATVTRPQVEAFVVGLFATCSTPNEFKTHVRDFLIQLKEFASKDSELLDYESQRRIAEEQAQEKARQQAIPGLYKPTTAEAAAPDDADEPEQMTDGP